MKAPAVIGVVLLGVLAQAVSARYTVGGGWAFDLVLVSVVAVGLHWGPVAGLLGGTLGGLLQDVLAGGLVGVGGFAKTFAGFAAGFVGSQFVLTQSSGRALVVALITPIHRLAMLGITALIDQHWPGVSWGAILAEVAINTFVAFAVLQGAATLPGALARGRANRRASLGRRRW